MKPVTLIIASLFSLLCISTLHAQPVFQKKTNTPITSQGGDSRSVCWVDVNGDDLLDLFISNGKEGGENNFLYLNTGNGQFEALEGSPIVQDGTPSDGASWADYDNDGDLDCVVVNWYGVNNLLYRNDGNAGNFPQFSLIQTSVVGQDGGFSEDVSWGDYDNDGHLDLYISNSAGNKRNFLYRNDGSGGFQKVLNSPAATDQNTSRCVTWTDYDHDGDPDLFVTNEEGQNENLYRNDAGVFTKVTGGPLLTAGGKTMSASWGDYDNDGLLDVFLANDGGVDKLFHNEGSGVFTLVGGTPFGTGVTNSFGSQWADINNDGWLDLFVTHAFWGGPWKNALYINNGNGTFTQNTTEAPSIDQGWSYGCAFGDLDKDGDLDLAVANCYNATQDNSLYENISSENGNSWLEIELKRTQTNRSAIGSKVWLTADIDGETITQLREISAQTGHCGQNQLAAHFGLGKLDSIRNVVVEWSSGNVNMYTDIQPNQWINLVEQPSSMVQELPQWLEDIAFFPNPFSDIITANINLKEPCTIHFECLDTSGRVVLDLGWRNLPNGAHKIEWSGASFNSGAYLIKCTSGSSTILRKVIKH
jgi:hypothetical protein